jgi:hypothetical protein
VSHGPTNSAGTAWINRDKPEYGLHPTPGLEQVGPTEAKRCFWLANGNTKHLLKLVRAGMPEQVEP